MSTLSGVQFGTVAGYLVCLGTLGLATASFYGTRIAQKMRFEERCRRHDIEAVCMSAFTSPAGDVNITWPKLYFINNVTWYAVHTSPDDTITTDFTAITCESRGAGYVNLKWRDPGDVATGKWLVLYVDPYGTQRALYGNVTGCLLNERSPRDRPADDTVRMLEGKLAARPQQ